MQVYGNVIYFNIKKIALFRDSVYGLLKLTANITCQISLVPVPVAARSKA